MLLNACCKHFYPRAFNPFGTWLCTNTFLANFFHLGSGCDFFPLKFHKCTNVDYEEKKQIM